VAVIGKRVRNATPEEAASAIFGWTIGNDVTERDWQKQDPTNLRAKNADTFKPMGPWIATAVDPIAMTTQVRLNGTPLHTFPTGHMLFGPGEVISAISRYNTLSPGDVVWLGTDECRRAQSRRRDRDRDHQHRRAAQPRRGRDVALSWTSSIPRFTCGRPTARTGRSIRAGWTGRPLAMKS
jgi:2-keto-4-pentenoate hydratase/2-oxohepta-3-ene-1,7-dioic acid hydratase in catechol pathway